MLRSERRKLRTASTTGERRGAPLRGGREKKGLKVAVVRDMGASAPARVRAGRPKTFFFFFLKLIFYFF